MGKTFKRPFKIGYETKRILWISLKKIGIPLCEGHEQPCFKLGKRSRQFTAYANDEANYVFVCKDCLDTINDYWQERWDEYYSMF